MAEARAPGEHPSQPRTEEQQLRVCRALGFATPPSLPTVGFYKVTGFDSFKLYLDFISVCLLKPHAKASRNSGARSKKRYVETCPVDGCTFKILAKQVQPDSIKIVEALPHICTQEAYKDVDFNKLCNQKTLKILLQAIYNGQTARLTEEAFCNAYGFQPGRHRIKEFMHSQFPRVQLPNLPLIFQSQTAPASNSATVAAAPAAPENNDGENSKKRAASGGWQSRSKKINKSLINIDVAIQIKRDHVLDLQQQLDAAKEELAALEQEKAGTANQPASDGNSRNESDGMI